MENTITNIVEEYRVIGLMSGTSLDGLDIAFCTFRKSENGWSYSIDAAETIPYTSEWKQRLSMVESGSAFDYVQTDVAFGHFCGLLTHEFIGRHGLRPDFIASHGHTVFHRPGLGITSQIGRGPALAAETGLPVVCDFRSLDVALGGQGAPLVPAGDALLFREYGYCLNIGGFANISHDAAGVRVAYDLCPANIVLNHLAGQLGLSFDPGGKVASAGSTDLLLLQRLNDLEYYHRPFPKSLGKEWVLEHVFPLLEASGLPVGDQMSTVCEHAAMQIAAAVRGGHGESMLVTGGGAFNTFLVGRIRAHARPGIVIPDPLTVNFKEALVFAFLGVLRMRNESNCLRSVTGARHDSSGGVIC